MSNKLSTKPLSGFMELVPEEQRLFNQVMDIIKDTYESCGFIPMDQPLLDRKDVLLAKAGGETEKQIYELTKGDTELALRFDLTVPLARYVADKYGQLTFPFRRYAIGKVYRGERAQAGRFREFYQCDVDIIGNENLALGYDAEMPIMIARVFDNLNKELQTGSYKIRINNRKLLSGLFEELNVTTQSTEILALIDKCEKISAEEFESLLQKLELPDAAQQTITAFLSAGLQSLSELGVSNQQFQVGVNEIRFVLQTAQASGLNPEVFVFDPTIVRGLDYYTGTVFETQFVNYPQFGSVCSGGRYDNLAGQYTNRHLPGVGMSIGLSRLFDQLLKSDVLKKSSQKASSRAVIIPMDNMISQALSVQKDLLENNISTEINWATGKLDKRIGYVDKMGIPYVILIGEQEVEQGLYTIRNMETGDEQKVAPGEIPTILNHE